MRRTMAMTAVAVGVVIAAGCGDDSSYTYEEPATVEEVSEGLWRIELTEQAEQRTGLETVEISINGSDLKELPYSAVMYHFDGTTWTYTNPEPQVFVRAPIEIERIEGDVAILVSGPDVGTTVVSVGAAELYGVEFGIGK